MELAASEAERWEQGCQSDVVRNGFIAPNLGRILETHKPHTILDIGTGTGYVPRIVDQQLSYRPAWTLIDLNRSRLALAERLKGSTMQMATIAADVLEHRFNTPFDAVLITFTMLEIVDADRLIDRLPTIVGEEGLLLLSIPDTWRDVLSYSVDEPGAVTAFLAGTASVPKIDKFTGDSYPFRAMRIEYLISQVLTAGFELFELAESNSNDTGTYILAFRRRRSLQ